MATFRERVSSKGDRKWQAIVRRDGFPDKRATFPTRRDAERWARIVEGEYAKRKHLPSLEAERHTLGELLDRYTEHDMPDKRRKACAAHLKFWREALGSKRLSELTPAAIREHRDRLRTEPFTRSFQRKAVTLTRRRTRKEGDPAPTYPRSPGSVNRYMETLSKMLTVAVAEYEWLPENPAAKIPDLKEPQGRVRFLSAHERDALLQACQAEGADLYALVVVALCTGARAGELLGLTWKDLDLERQRAVLNRTKNEERRALSLTGPALTVLRERSKVRRIDTDLVFPHPTTKGRYHYAKPFKAALSKAEITDFRFHDLRHTTASYLAMHGATTPEIAAVLGHKTLAMVKRYAHLSDQHVAGVVERMTGSVFGDAGKAAS
jgi:integrase